MKSLLFRLFPGAAALAALLFLASWITRADPKPSAAVDQVEPSYQQPAPQLRPQPVYQAPAPSYTAAPAPATQLVCGSCGELLQPPQAVMIAQPVQGRGRADQAHARPVPVQRYYDGPAGAPVGYYEPQPAQRVIYVMPEALDEIGYRPGAPIASVFPLSTNFRMPAEYIPPYSDAQVRAWRRAHAHPVPVRW